MKWINWIFKPVSKAIFGVLSVYSSGILCSALVAELPVEKGNIKWTEMINKNSFYIIVAILVLSIPYNAYAAKVEINFRQKINTKFLSKFLEDKGLVTLADEVSDAIKNNDISKLTNLLDMKELITKNLEAK